MTGTRSPRSGRLTRRQFGKQGCQGTYRVDRRQITRPMNVFTVTQRWADGAWGCGRRSTYERRGKTRDRARDLEDEEMSSVPVSDTDGSAEGPELVQDVSDPLLQLAADAALLRRLAEAGFAGPEYQLFERELAAYGIAVCEAWLVTGLMFRRCAEK